MACSKANFTFTFTFYTILSRSFNYSDLQQSPIISDRRFWLISIRLTEGPGFELHPQDSLSGLRFSLFASVTLNTALTFFSSLANTLFDGL